VPGLPAQGGGTRRKRGCDVTDLWDVRAVLLDMDGTLLDTERVYFDSLVGALNAFGYTDDVEALCHAMVGLPGPDCEAMLQARYGESFPLAEINKASAIRRNEIRLSPFNEGKGPRAGSVNTLIGQKTGIAHKNVSRFGCPLLCMFPCGSVFRWGAEITFADSGSTSAPGRMIRSNSSAIHPLPTKCPGFL
jgi:hypothetical protein